MKSMSGFFCSVALLSAALGALVAMNVQDKGDKPMIQGISVA